MAFVRETMTEADHTKVFTAESVVALRKNCIPQEKWDSTRSNTYAIDRERNAIFLLVQKFAPIDTLKNYLLIVDGVPLALQLGGEIGWTVFPFRLPKELNGRELEVQQLICDAFAVYGSSGFGDPASLLQKVIPEFQD